MASTPSESHDELENLERKHADNPEGRYFVPLANLYRRGGDVQRAIGLLRQGLQKHPDYLSAHIVLGRCLADEGDAEAAETEFRYVLSLDPQNLIALRTLGELALSRDDLPGAEKWYQDLLTVDPMNEDARRALEEIASRPETAAGEEPLPDSSPQAAAPDGVALAAPPAGNREEEVIAEATGADDDDAIYGTMIDLDGSSDDPFEEEGDAVVTETIAELYTRQGFYDRAAEVYRELLRRRGDDPRLQESLRRVEALARGAEVNGELDPAVGTPSSESTAEPELIDDSSVEQTTGTAADVAEEWTSGDPNEASTDHFAESFQMGFPAAEAPAPSSEPLQGDLATATADGQASGGDESGSDVSIRSFLAGVVSWEPPAATAEVAEGGVEVAEPQLAEEPDEEEEFGAVLGLESGYYDLGDEIASGSDLTPAYGTPEDEPDSWLAATLDGVPGDDSAPTELDSREEMADVGGAEPADETEEPPTLAPAVSDEDLFPWEIPTEPEPSRRSAEPDSPRSVDAEIPADLFPGAPAASEGEATDAGASADGYDSASADVEESPPTLSTAEAEEATEPTSQSDVRADAPEEPDPASGDSEDEDDDLESFQAWLRSLKR